MLPPVNLGRERIAQTKQREDKNPLQHMASVSQTRACTMCPAHRGSSLALPPATNLTLLSAGPHSTARDASTEQECVLLRAL